MVTVKIGPETFLLTCNLQAFRDIPAVLDGFMGAYTKLAQADPNACIAIIALGSGSNKPAEQERIAELLFEHGIAGVIPPLSEYIGLLQVGGRVRKEAQSGVAGK